MIERSRGTFLACRADKTGLVTARRTMVRRNFITRSKQKVARQAAMHLKSKEIWKEANGKKREHMRIYDKASLVGLISVRVPLQVQSRTRRFSRQAERDVGKGERSVLGRAPSLPPDSIKVLFVAPSHRK